MNKSTTVESEIEDARKEDIVVSISRSTRNYEIDSIFDKDKKLKINADELKEIFYRVEYAVIESIGDIIETSTISNGKKFGKKEVASTIANRAFDLYLKNRAFI